MKTTLLLGSMILGISTPLFAQVPDLTKDTQAVNRNATYNLGATGLRGWIYTKAPNKESPTSTAAGITCIRGGKT